MGALLNERRDRTSDRINLLRRELSSAEKLCSDKACVYATGSYGRGEATSHSDLDLFIVGRTIGSESVGKKPALRNLEEIILKANLIDATRKLGIRDFDGDGAFLVHYTVDELISYLGKPDDDANNTFTARLLLILESRPLLECSLYRDLTDQVVSVYWADYSGHQDDFTPAFLANDILRLWRTFCVNYEANTARNPEEKNARRRLKNYKLKHSRLLTCYSALLYLLGCYAHKSTVSPTAAAEMVALSPTQRLEWILDQSSLSMAHSKVADLLESYSRFLEGTDAPEKEMIERFLDPEIRKRYARVAHQLGDSVFELFELLGQGNRLHRLLVV